MSLCTTDSVICTFCLILAVFALAEIWAIIRGSPAFETWDCAIDFCETIPPLPVIVYLIMEPYIHTTSDCDIRCPCSIKISFNNSIGSIDVLFSGNWHGCGNLPCVNMCHFLTLCGWEAKFNGFREGGLQEGGDACLHRDAVRIFHALGYWPWACWGGGSWLFEVKWTVLFQGVAIVLG